MPERNSKKAVHCSFCNKDEDEVPCIVNKGTVAICNLCVSLFASRLEENQFDDSTEPFKDCSFCSFLRNSMPPFSEIVADAGVSLENKDFSELKMLYDGIFSGRKTDNPDAGRKLFRKGFDSICDECVDLCKEMISLD